MSNTMLVVEPNELRAWRLRLGLEQSQLAQRAKLPRERISLIEQRLSGRVSTYQKANKALRAIEAEHVQGQEKIA